MPILPTTRQGNCPSRGRADGSYGEPRVFDAPELSIDVLLASACLPFVFQAVEIDGEPYWDGGYTGNPALYPLIYDSHALDILLVS